jgi:hypothetical protein
VCHATTSEVFAQDDSDDDFTAVINCNVTVEVFLNVYPVINKGAKLQLLAADLPNIC